MTVDTKRITGRRKLRYNTLQEIVDDAERITSRPFRTLGNWSAGQIFMHLARTMDIQIDGSQAKMPWIVRIIAPIFKKRLLRDGMPAGFKMPKRLVKELLPGEVTTEDGLRGLKSAVHRLQTTADRKPHIVFGVISREESDQIQMRHAETHMSFLVPE